MLPACLLRSSYYTDTLGSTHPTPFAIAAHLSMAPTKTLNPLARPFVPGSPSQQHFAHFASVFEATEENITPEELEELELAEEWVLRMAEVEESESEHLIELALRFAPKGKLSEIQSRYGMTQAVKLNRGAKKGMKRQGRAM